MIVVLLMMDACSMGQTAVTEEDAAGQGTAVVHKSGAILWSENCSRCHNFRNPTSYSDLQWSVAMHHMRVRANLTADEHRKILEFLQMSN